MKKISLLQVSYSKRKCMWYNFRIELPPATFSGVSNLTIIVDTVDKSVRVPVNQTGQTWDETIEDLFEVGESSTHPKVFSIAIEAKGCNNTVATTTSVPMSPKAVEMPKITLDPLESVIFREKVLIAKLHKTYSLE